MSVDYYIGGDRNCPFLRTPTGHYTLRYVQQALNAYQEKEFRDKSKRNLHARNYGFEYDPHQTTVGIYTPRKEQQMRLYECVIIYHNRKEETFETLTEVRLITADNEENAKMTAALEAQRRVDISSTHKTKDVEVLCRPFV